MSAGAVVGSVVSVIATVVSAYGSAQASESAEDQAKYAARVARDQAAAEEAEVRRKGQQEIGRQRAVLGKLGVLPTAGTPLEQLARNAGEVERAAVQARAGLLTEASLFDIQARSISAQKGYLVASNVLSGLATTANYASPLLSTTGGARVGNSAGAPYVNTRGLT